MTRSRGASDPQRPAAALATVHDDTGAVIGALVATERAPAAVSGVPPPVAPSVVAALARAGYRATAASGPVFEGAAFAAAHVARHGGTARMQRRLRLLALSALVRPHGVTGSVRRAGPADEHLVRSWRVDGAREAGVPGAPSPAEVRQQLADPDHCEMLWEIDGQPVAQAATRRPVAGMSRIGSVYTPPDRRGRGHAAAVTAAITSWALDAGATRILLFADPANPTSGRLYPRLGFRAIGDAMDVDLRAQHPHPSPAVGP